MTFHHQISPEGMGENLEGEALPQCLVPGPSGALTALSDPSQEIESHLSRTAFANRKAQQERALSGRGGGNRTRSSST
jgi:hypothetical protein